MDNDTNLSKKEIQQITEFLDLDNGFELGQADLAFLFGTSYADPAYIATDLFRQGIIRHIVTTGGTNRVTGVNEAQAHTTILLQAGVPHDWITVEDESTNTLENVIFAIPKLQVTVDLNQVKSIVVITKWYHSRRATMTLKRHMPSGIRYHIRSYTPEGVSPKDWYLHEASRKRVLKEWERIPYYLQLGHIAEIRQEAKAYV